MITIKPYKRKGKTISGYTRKKRKKSGKVRTDKITYTRKTLRDPMTGFFMGTKSKKKR